MASKELERAIELQRSLLQEFSAAQTPEEFRSIYGRFLGRQPTRRAGEDRRRPVSFEPWPDMIHVWQWFGSFLSEARQAIDRIGEFIRQRTS